jgi:anti-anti-sigma factor
MNLGQTLDTRTGPKSSLRPDHKIVALHGELDIATTPALRERLNGALTTAAGLGRRLVIDLSGVSFCDASGLAVLIGTQRRARILGTPMSLAAPQPQVLKLLHITGLDRGLTIHASLVAALHAEPSAVATRSRGAHRVVRARARV